LQQDLALHNAKHPVQLLQVKHKTISNAILYYQEDHDYEMTMGEIGAISQVLTTMELRDSNGNMIKSNFMERKRAILSKIFVLEEKHRGESSSERSSKHSRHADVRLAPPLIAVEA